MPTVEPSSATRAAIRLRLSGAEVARIRAAACARPRAFARLFHMEHLPRPLKEAVHGPAV